MKITNENKSKVFKRAYWMIKGGAFDSETLTFGEALKRAWAEIKAYITKKSEEAEIKLQSDLFDLRQKYNVMPTEDYKLELAFNRGETIKTC